MRMWNTKKHTLSYTTEWTCSCLQAEYLYHVRRVEVSELEGRISVRPYVTIPSSNTYKCLDNIYVPFYYRDHRVVLLTLKKKIHE